jgi:hypothetical protein
VIAFQHPEDWASRILDVVAWQGDLAAIAAALQTFGGLPVRVRLAMPMALRRLFLNDLHRTCFYFETGELSADPEDFKKVVRNALAAVDWFRFHNGYANGELIMTA